MTGSCKRAPVLRRHAQQRRTEAAAEAASAGLADADEQMRFGPPRRTPEKTAIVGGGPAGLATAIMLARRGWKNITVYDRLEAPPKPGAKVWGNADRSYNLGINGRGQKALKGLDALDSILPWAAPITGRMDWDDQGRTNLREASNKTTTTVVIQRDRLVACLLQEIHQKYRAAVTVQHGVECVGADWSTAATPAGLPRSTAVRTAPVMLAVAPVAALRSEEDLQGEMIGVDVDLMVAADGVRSSVVEALSRAPDCEIRWKAYKESNTRVYKTVGLTIPDSWRKDLNYSANALGGKGITLEALPTVEGNLVGLLLFKPENERMAQVQTEDDARALFEECFPDFLPLVKPGEFKALAERPICRFPGFQYAGPALHWGASAVLVGDSVHTVKPYFGVGVNSAFEDVATLEDCLDKASDDPKRALELYSRRHAPNARALVEMSRDLDRGFFRFVLPLILDGMFHSFAPDFFAPNTIRMLQKDDWSFAAIQQRKRRDRMVQCGVLFSVLAAVLFALRTAISTAWSAVCAALPAAAGAL
ncbi:unnamed protein product [Pedinophyceae sp. YPF-701]|nr:unnamed protein product [Pedinophyceae sp. YPF-701]